MYCKLDSKKQITDMIQQHSVCQKRTLWHLIINLVWSSSTINIVRWEKLESIGFRNNLCVGSLWWYVPLLVKNFRYIECYYLGFTIALSCSSCQRRRPDDRQWVSVTEIHAVYYGIACATRTSKTFWDNAVFLDFTNHSEQCYESVIGRRTFYHFLGTDWI